MTFLRLFSRVRLLPLVAIGFVGLAVQAMPLGIQVTKDQEAQVRPGMSTDDVRQVLGRPSTNMQFRNEPGPTYTYRVAGNVEYLFDVDFDANGRVLSSNERMSYIGGDGRRGGR